jgi:cytochrome c peroxidase
MRRIISLSVARKKVIKLSAIFAMASVLGMLLTANYIGSLNSDNQPDSTVSSVGHGDVNTLKTALDAWRENYEAKGGNAEVLRLLLGYSKAQSSLYTQGHAQFQLNLKTGEVIFQTKGLDAGQYDLWLIDSLDQPIQSKVDDNALKIGSFAVENGKGGLESQLERSKLLGFTLNSIVVSKAGQSPLENTVITGAPDLMHKLYYADKPWLTTAMGDFKDIKPDASMPFDFLLPKAAHADTLSDLTPVLGALVAQGRQIFHKETFNGNGRTCETCHRADNNFTIDPNYIMKLPPNDPLFVAETNPALADLENPVLMRKHGLILTNVDGPGIDVFRSVSHTLAMATTIKSELLADGGEFAADETMANATGWSGDGAPGSGSLREFTLGAVAQHMPKTMARNAGVDFRLPTEAELDAVEAYMLSLGRSKDYPVYQLTFNDPLTEAGKDLFDTKTNPKDASGAPILGKTANCNGCHQNAGGRSSSTKANPTRNTGIEQMKIHPARLLKPDMAYDGGFGTSPAFCGADAPDEANCFGDGRFNTTPLIEAADTAPYFHNNAVSTLEEAIAAYNSDAFNTSPGHLSKGTDRTVKLDSTQVVAVASFLRAINALENIRMSDQLDNQARQINNNATAREIARLGREENQDAIQVLKEGVLGNSWQAVLRLERAAYFQNLAQLAPVRALRNSMLNQAMAQKKQARELIASCDPSAIPAATVVVPPAELQYTCREIGL